MVVISHSKEKIGFTEYLKKFEIYQYSIAEKSQHITGIRIFRRHGEPKYFVKRSEPTISSKLLGCEKVFFVEFFDLKKVFFV